MVRQQRIITSRAAVLALALIALLCARRPAHAGSASVSYSTWVLSGDTVMLRFVVPAAEAQRLTGSAIPVLTVSKLGDYVLHHTAVSASGQDCPAIDQGYDLGRVDPVQVGAGLYGFEIFFRCGAPMQSLVLEDHALFDRAVDHVDFARIEVGWRFTDQLFPAARQSVHIADPAAVPAAGIWQYVRLGMGHVAHDAGEICFLLAALLLVRGRRDAALIVFGLAAGHALSLLAQAWGLIVAGEPLIGAFAGFLVALAAIAIVVPELRRPQVAITGWSILLLMLALIAAGLRALHPALLLAGAAALSAGLLTAVRRSGRQPWFASSLAVVMGFLGGFALPSLLGPLHLPERSEIRMAISYDLGALLTAAGVVALVAGAVALVGGAGRLSPTRSGAEVLAASIFGGLGMFWLVSGLQG